MGNSPIVNICRHMERNEKSFSDHAHHNPQRIRKRTLYRTKWVAFLNIMMPEKERNSTRRSNRAYCTLQSNYLPSSIDYLDLLNNSLISGFLGKGRPCGLMLHVAIPNNFISQSLKLRGVLSWNCFTVSNSPEHRKIWQRSSRQEPPTIKCLIFYTVLIFH